MSKQALYWSIAVAGFAALVPRAAVDAQGVLSDPSFASETDRPETCLRERGIRESHVVDDGTILFIMKSGVAYANALNRLADLVLELPRACIGLAEQEIEFARTRVAKICTGDQIEIRVADDDLRPFLPTCRLGVFYRISAAEAEELLARRRAPAPPPSDARSDDGEKP